VSKAPGEAPGRARWHPQGLLIHPELSSAQTEAQLDYPTTALHYGTKVAGLRVLPPAWVPPYVAVPCWAFEEWARKPEGWVARIRRKQLSLEIALQLASENGRYPVIVRSSAVGEGLEDRGLYKSLRLDAGVGLDGLAAAIEEIFSDFEAQIQHSAIGICLQRHMPRELAGHVSNEVRLSATRNQWKYGIEVPAVAPERGLNSKFADSPEEQLPLMLTSPSGLSTVLRRICHWVNLRIDRRSHLEWCAANGRLWVVQLDEESPNSPGVDPHVMPDARSDTGVGAGPLPGDSFTPHRAEDESRWHKLRILRDFWTGAEPPRHRLFFATGQALAAALARDGGRSALAAEIDRLTGGRAVLRTDCNYPRIERSNLRRTNTVGGADAAAWVAETLAVLRAKGAADDEIAIILHRYIPARAAAWTYYSPNDDIVHIDCLWGLPDGLQFLSHDSFEIDARTALRWIALETVAVARKINERAQIMWFCDLPSELDLGQYLPWYRSKDFMGFAPVDRPALPTRLVRNLADLEDLAQNEVRCIIELAPEVELVRDDENFLDRVIELAGARSVPVELSGSVLGHAYYRLRAAKILVLAPHRKYPRVRGRRRHYKVVRDDIPQSIAAKGERVMSAHLAEGEAAVALISKLFEEGLEMNDAKEPAQKLEELADVLEVVRGLAVTSGIEWDELEAIAAAKRENRGGFEQQTVLLETARPMPPRASEPRGGDNQSLIPLRDLGMVTVQGASASISFSRLLSSRSMEVALTVSGRLIQVAVALDAAGVRLLATEPESANQLKLFEDRSAAELKD
jgi:predicted house-cleaning noncanonical NTP pyrophosphatase (MazG superfamily)